MDSLRRLGSPCGTPGSASPDCSGFALVGGTVKRKTANPLTYNFVKFNNFNLRNRVEWVSFLQVLFNSPLNEKSPLALGAFFISG